MEVRLGNIFGFTGGNYSGNVYDQNFMCPTLNTMQGGCKQPMIIDDTYANRQPRVYEDYSPALRSEREGLKTIETISTKGKQIEVASTILAGYERTNMTGFNADNGVVEVMSDEKRNAIEILQTLRKEIGEKDFSKWAIRGLWCVLQEEILRQNMYAKGIYENWTHRPELFKFAYNSKGNQYSIHSEKAMRNMWEEWTVRCTPQRRGLSEQQCREFDDFMSKLPYETTQRKEFVHCLWKASEGIGVLRKALSEIQEIWESINNKEAQRCFYRIRKLTPRCCWRLMDFTDEDFEKAAQVNSNTQLYKQAGNSIVKNVLVAILGQMIPGKEDVYKN